VYLDIGNVYNVNYIKLLYAHAHLYVYIYVVKHRQIMLTTLRSLVPRCRPQSVHFLA